MVTVCRALAALLLAAAVLAAGSGTAGAEPSVPATDTAPPAASTTYGFDELCNQIHDQVSQIPLVGGIDGDVLSGFCKAGNAATHPGQALDATRSKLWDSAFGQVVDSLLDGLGQAMAAVMTMWVRLPNEKLLDSPTLWQRIDSYTRTLQVWMLAVSIAVSALRIGVARKQLAADHAEETFRMLARSAATTWIAGTAILAGARITDRFAEWLITDSTGATAGGAAELLVKNYRATAGLLSPGFVFVVTLVGLLGAVSMAALTVIRQAFLVVAVGVFPLTAAASGTAAGRQSFQRLGAWIIAFLLFKPCAAVVYMIAFVTADQANTEAGQQVGSTDSAARALIGMVLLCSAAFVLPALMRLVAPALSAVGSGGSGAVATGVAAGAAAAAVTGGKALLARSAMAGAFAGTGGGGGTTATGHRGGPPPGSGGGGGRPSLPPAPKPGGGALGVAPARSSDTSSGPRGTARAARRGAAAAGAGRSVERVGDTATGTSAGTDGARWVNKNPNLGNDHIDR